MALKTVTVSVKLIGPDALPLANAQVEATLSAHEVDGGIIVPGKVKAMTNSLGIALLPLWPNSRGSASTKYAVRVVNFPSLFNVVIVVPDSLLTAPIDIQNIINAAPYPPVAASEQALLAAQAAIVQASASATAAAISAEESKRINITLAAAYVSTAENLMSLRTLFINHTGI